MASDDLDPDNWITRDPNLIKLTGTYPFNAEPPLDQLMDQGFTTSVALHYVRNHGAVPQATWEDWTIEVSGLVKQPTQFTMDQLVNQFTSQDLTVTLVCSGNRREEQNKVKPTNGFNWGAAVLSTSVWRGIPLRSILEKCEIDSVENGALHVCLEGGDTLHGGKGYGTSIRREVVMDPSCDIIVAFEQNGERLAPDHGFPVRLIIPGYIGGRMVKWLTRITVTTNESDNYYHLRDNKVLPSYVDAELAESEGWWYKSEYNVNELNINSVITTPKHGEKLAINSSTTTYTLKGYAYSGGGKKVTRVEVTIDGGQTWLACTVDHQEEPNEYGKYWCWCFWSLDVEVVNLIGAKEIAVRAWDETLNTQPETLIWNLLGVMNNDIFRVKIKGYKLDTGEIGMVFQHPTQPGTLYSGWMDPEGKQKPVWIIYNGYLYDVTTYIDVHPGGPGNIINNALTDVTEMFNEIHDETAWKLLETFRIGQMVSTE